MIETSKVLKHEFQEIHHIINGFIHSFLFNCSRIQYREQTFDRKYLYTANHNLTDCRSICHDIL